MLVSHSPPRGSRGHGTSGGARNLSLCCHFKFMLSNTYVFTYFILFFILYMLVYEGVSKILCGQLTTQVLTWLRHCMGREHGWIESETVPPPIRVADLL
jgi:hypothetical protein